MHWVIPLSIPIFIILQICRKTCHQHFVSLCSTQSYYYYLIDTVYFLNNFKIGIMIYFVLIHI